MQRANEGDTKYATRERTPTNIDNMIYYSEDYPCDYIITHDEEYIISLPSIPVGAAIVSVDLEIKRLPVADYTWNPTSRILTLVDNSPHLTTADGPTGYYPTTAGQLLSVIYKIKKTTL